MRRYGRVLDHVDLRASDLEASRRFYAAALGALGVEITLDEPHGFGADELFVEGADPRPTTGVHLAFQAADRAAVHRFHEAALGAGGTDNGPPGPRDFGPGYYAAFVLDPDGNNVEAVAREGHARSAQAVELTEAGA